MRSLFISCSFIILIAFNVQPQDRNYHLDKEKAVYFFGPSETEMDTINEDEADAIDDFYYYTGLVVPYINLNQIKAEYISARNIEIPYDSLMYITVHRDSVDFGTILTDGINPPKILEYVLTNDELKGEIRTFFNLR